MAKRAGHKRSQQSGIGESEAGQRKDLRRFVEDFTGKRLYEPWRRLQRRVQLERLRLP